MIGFLGGDDRGIGGKHEMNTGVGDEVGLELSDVDVEGAVESEGGSEGRDNLGDESVQVGVGGSLDVELSSADVVDGFVVEHDGDVGVLEEGVGAQDGVVRFDDRVRNLRGGVDCEAEFGFFAVVDGESFEKEGAETGSSSSSDGVEDEEALETSAVVSELSDSVEGEVDDFLADGAVASGVVVCGVFLSGDELLRVEELSVCAGSDFVDDGGFEIEEDASGDVLAGSCFGEECVKGVISTSNGFVGRHLSVGLNSVFKTE